MSEVIEKLLHDTMAQVSKRMGELESMRNELLDRAKRVKTAEEYGQIRNDLAGINEQIKAISYNVNSRED